MSRDGNCGLDLETNLAMMTALYMVDIRQYLVQMESELSSVSGHILRSIRELNVALERTFVLIVLQAYPHTDLHDEF